jgi:hypothetical protein
MRPALGRADRLPGATVGQIAEDRIAAFAPAQNLY